jgi:D-amino-acid oxidase
VEDPAACERPEVPGGYEFGWRYRTFFIDTSIFLSWLAVRFETAGGLLAPPRRFLALEELGHLPHDVVFNCTGLGARTLCGDDAVAPVKGQIVVVAPRPDMDWSITHDGFYVYPRRNDTILGGTWEADVWDEGVEHGAIEAILRANQRLLPELKPPDVRASYAGLRPYRAGGIRLDVQSVGTRTIVHNYGHAGAGITLCWGSARAALGLVT